MNKEERIKLRDELFDEFKSLGIINKQNHLLRLKLKNLNIDLQIKWDAYLKEFTCIEEAIYCILKNDDFENHICHKCGDIYVFDHKNKMKYHTTCKKCDHNHINYEELIQFIKEENDKKKTKITISEIQKKFKISYSTLNSYIKKYNLLDYVKINLWRDIDHYDIWSNNEKFIQFIKEEYDKKGPLTISYLKKFFIDNDAIIKNKIEKLGLLKYFHIGKNSSQHIKYYDIWNDDNKFTLFVIDEFNKKGSSLSTSELENYFSVTNNSVRSKIRRLNLLNYVNIKKHTKKDVKYPDIWNDDEKFIEFIKNQYNLKGTLLTVPEIRKYLLVNDDSLRAKIKQFNLTDYFHIKSTSQEHIQHYDIWNDDEKFIEFITNEYNKKDSFLLMPEIALYFNVCSHRVRCKITRLNLLNYFYIQQSNLEIDFESFLNVNNIKFKKNDKSILYNQNERKEIDFLCENIGFEINDISTHNSSNKNDIAYKDPSYHQQKSLLAREKGIQLIHIWEWEMRNEEVWNKLSKWILNKFNDNKKIIDINECTIKNINQEIAESFSDLYNLNDFKNNNYYIGVYYKEELVQVIIINLLTYQADIITKFGFSITDKNKQLIHYCNQELNIQSLYSLCDISKDNENEYIQLGFNLINTIDPNPIWCNKKMEFFNEFHDLCVPVYDCGYNKYRLTL